MDRLLLMLVTFGSAAVSWIAPRWPWVSGVATALVGAVGLVTTIKAERRAEEAERREREAFAWERDKREAEQRQARARDEIAAWVTTKKSQHGRKAFPVDLATELDVARAAESLGLIELKELRTGEGVLDAAAWVI